MSGYISQELKLKDQNKTASNLGMRKMKRDTTYSNIDMEQTGKILQQRIGEKGYSVGEIQKMLMLACPQPVYRWLKGQILPSVNHLYMLSQILGCHMEDLLVEKWVDYVLEFVETERSFMANGRKRMAIYGRWRWRKLREEIEGCEIWYYV